MKKLVLILALAAATLGVSAQNSRTITGVVIDENGNPIPNALVQATGGAESVSTDADGSFSLEVPIYLKSITAKYAGLETCKIGIRNKDNFVFEMKKPIGSWFINGVYGIGSVYGSLNHDVGLMGGYLGKWGGYMKATVSVCEDAVGPNITLGAIKKVGPIYINLGLGYGSCMWEDYDCISGYNSYYNYYYTNYYYYMNWSPGMAADLGVMYKYKHFNVGLGYSLVTDFYDLNHHFQLTVGYCFR